MFDREAAEAEKWLLAFMCSHVDRGSNARTEQWEINELFKSCGWTPSDRDGALSLATEEGLISTHATRTILTAEGMSRRAEFILPLSFNRAPRSS